MALSIVTEGREHGRPGAHQSPITADQGHLRALPQDNSIPNEFYQVAFRKKIYSSLKELQADLDAWLEVYNHERTHQGKMCCGRTPMATFEDGKRICREKMIA